METCALLVYDNSSSTTPSQSELKRTLETGDEKQKIEALKQAINLILSGEKLPQLLMVIIRFVLTSKNHTIKKLLLLYWEVIDMVGPDGQILPEMILVCNSLRNDLLHPNEYVRGSTLRFICKVKIAELLEPLVPSIIKNLEHRHTYVRRNAVLALHSVHAKIPQLCPDAPEIVAEFIQKEEDSSCRRNALSMLFSSAPEAAVKFLNENCEQASSWGDSLQFTVIDVIRKHTRQGISDGQKAMYVRIVLSLLQANSPAVQFEAASALLDLSSAPISAKAAGSTFIELLVNQSDNNVKLVTLEKLAWLKKKHNKVLQELLLDILRALSCPTLDIRQKTLDFALDLVNPRNIDEVVMLLKKEINKTLTEELDKAGDYRRMLIKAIHSCALKFPDVAGNVVLALLDHIGDDNHSASLYVATFAAEVVETYPEHRNTILMKLLDSISDVKGAPVMRIALWIIGSYTESVDELDVSFTKIKHLLGPMPFFSVAEESEPSTTPEPSQPTTKTVSKVLADGTYATQSALVPENAPSKQAQSNVAYLRREILKGNFPLATNAVSALTKIALKLLQASVSEAVKNRVVAEVLYIAASCLQYASMPEHHTEPLSVDTSREEIIFLLKLLSTPNCDSSIIDSLLTESKKAFKQRLVEQKELNNEHSQKKSVDVQVDDVIDLPIFKTNRMANNTFDEDVGGDLLRATGANERENEGGLNRVYQLTGFSDPLYAECYINVHRYDIVLDVLIINRTKDTLQNVNLELFTLGDLKLGKRSVQSYTIAPLNTLWIQADVKVSSSDTGVICGNLVYDIAGSVSSDKHCVVLNNIRVDIIDYINPDTCSDSQFRSMWCEFEWENKVPVNAKANSVFEFLEDIVKATNMKCLTPQSAMQGDCGFLAANLFAKSIFGEYALANMSIEQLENGDISGYIRIRSKTQGIALSLGDKIVQRSQH